MNDDLRYYGNPMNWESTKGDLISREALKEKLQGHAHNGAYASFYVDDLINNAPTVKSYTLEDLEKAKNNGYKWGKIDGKKERLQGDCENCDYRKFTAQFTSGIVDVMDKNGITSVEQLMEILKGGKTDG